MSTETKRKIKILLLEDRLASARAIKKNLECNPNRELEVQYVKNLSQFQKRLKEEAFDIFIIDYDIPEDRGSKTLGGGEKALDILQQEIGLAPAIIYSGVLEGELQETEVIKKGASYILRKGKKGSALSALVERIINEHDEKIGFVLKSFFSARLGEKTFYLDLINEDRVTRQGDVKTIITVEVQRLFDNKPITYKVHLDKNGEVVHAEQEKT